MLKFVIKFRKLSYHTEWAGLNFYALGVCKSFKAYSSKLAWQPSFGWCLLAGAASNSLLPGMLLFHFKFSLVPNSFCHTQHFICIGLLPNKCHGQSMSLADICVKVGSAFYLSFQKHSAVNHFTIAWTACRCFCYYRGRQKTHFQYCCCSTLCIY